jgi:hypothetical protein
MEGVPAINNWRYANLDHSSGIVPPDPGVQDPEREHRMLMEVVPNSWGDD